MRVFAAGPNGPLEELAALGEAGHELVVGRPLDAPGRKAWTPPELVAAAAGAHVILASYLDDVGAEVIAALPQLRAVVVPMIGTDRIDVAAATRAGVLVANSPTVQNQVSVAEAAIGLMLMLLKRVKHNEALLRRGGWGRREDRGDLLMGRTVGIVGLGKTGSNVARRLAGWECELVGCDAYVQPEHAAALGVRLVDLDTLLRESDVVTLHASLTPETRGMLGENQLRRMKRTAVLVNLARGEMVDEAAIARALCEEWIAAAALDAFAPEPLPMDSALRGLDPKRLVLTPHNVSHTDAARRAGVALAVEQILAVGRGERPVNTINREVVPKAG